MRAFLLPFFFALLCAVPAKVFAADGNDGIRSFVNGSWKLTFPSETTAPDGSVQKSTTIITITLLYDGTRHMTTDVQDEGKPLERKAEASDFYRVDEVDGTKFTLTSWGGSGGIKTTNRARTGADTMAAEGSDAVYERIPNTQEGLLGPMPEQIQAPPPPPGVVPEPPAPPPVATPEPPPPPPPVQVTPEPPPPTPEATPEPTPAATEQEARDAALRAFMIGRWTVSVTIGAQLVESSIDYRPSGQLEGVQKVTTNGRTKSYSIKGAYAVVATGEKTFTLTLYIPGIDPIANDFEIVDQNTLFNAKQNYQAIRAP